MEKPTQRFLVRAQQLKVLVDPGLCQRRTELERKVEAEKKKRDKRGMGRE